MPTGEDNDGPTKLEETLAFLSTRFREYRFLTSLTDDIVAKMEKAGEVKLDATRRAAIELALKEFEFFTRLELQDYGKKFRKILGLLEKKLAEVALIAKSLDSLPGHLWSYLGDGSLLAEDVIRNLEARKRRLEELLRQVDSKPDGSADHNLPRLLEELAEEFKSAGGSVKISRKKEDRRGGPFVDFCDAAVCALPPAFRPQKSVGSRWDQMLLAKGKSRHHRLKNFVRRVHPGLAKL